MMISKYLVLASLFLLAACGLFSKDEDDDSYTETTTSGSGSGTSGSGSGTSGSGSGTSGGGSGPSGGGSGTSGGGSGTSGSGSGSSSASDNNTTFTVTVSAGKYSLDNVQGKTLTLRRGYTYSFDAQDSFTNSHPLYLGTSSTGGGYSDEYTSGVTNSPTTSGILTIVIPQAAPNSLYYNWAVIPIWERRSQLLTKWILVVLENA